MESKQSARVPTGDRAARKRQAIIRAARVAFARDGFHALRAALDAGDAEVAFRFVSALHWYLRVRDLSAQFASFLAKALKLADALPSGVVRLAPVESVLAAGRQAAGAAFGGRAELPLSPVPRLVSGRPAEPVRPRHCELRFGTARPWEAFEGTGDRWGLSLSLLL